jgi:hypothetical protein
VHGNIARPSVVMPGNRKSSHSQRHQGASALLHTCRQIRYEALPIFFARTTFDIGHDREWLRTLGEFGPATCKAIQSIKLEEWSSLGIGIGRFRQMNSLVRRAKWLFSAGLPSLQQIHVSVRSYGNWRARDHLPVLRERMKKLIGKEELYVYITELDQRGSVVKHGHENAWG